MALQGYCTKCMVRWVWDKNLRLLHTWCPNCGNMLTTTSVYHRRQTYAVKREAVDGTGWGRKRTGKNP